MLRLSALSVSCRMRTGCQQAPEESGMVQVADGRREQRSWHPTRNTALVWSADVATHSPMTLDKNSPLWASACLCLKWDSISSKADFDCDLP